MKYIQTHEYSYSYLFTNSRSLYCLLDCLFRSRSKKTSKLNVTGLCQGNSPVNSQHKGPVTRKMFPFDAVIMFLSFRDFFTKKYLLDSLNHICICREVLKLRFRGTCQIWTPLSRANFYFDETGQNELVSNTHQYPTAQQVDASKRYRSRILN